MHTWSHMNIQNYITHFQEYHIPGNFGGH